MTSTDKTYKYHLSPEQIDTEGKSIAQAQSDIKFFEPLYKAYYPRIIAFVYQRVDNKDQAYDITAQVFYAAINNLNKYKSTGVPFSAWLFRIAFNEINQWYRKTKNLRTVNIDDEGLSNLKDEIAEISPDELNKKLFTAIQTLDTEEIEIIELRFFESHSFAEIATITGLGESACKMRIYRALEKLKQKLIIVKY